MRSSKFFALSLAIVLTFGGLGADSAVARAGSTSSSGSRSSAPSSSGISRPYSAPTRSPESPSVRTLREDSGSSGVGRPGSGITRPQFVAPEQPSSGVSRPNQFAAPEPPASGISRPGAAAGGESRSADLPTSGVSRPGATPSGVSRPNPAVAQEPRAASVVPPARPAPSAVDRRIELNQSQSALAAFRADQQKFKQPAPTPAPEAAQASPVWKQYGSRWTNYDQYRTQSESAIGRLPPERAQYWSNPPAYVREGPSAYGAFQSPFLASLLGGAAGSIAGNALWAYSHQDDEGYRHWHADMTARGNDDPQVREHLAALDAQVADLKAKQAAKSDALPAGVDPALVIAPQTVLAATTPAESHWGHTLIVLMALAVLAGVGFVLFRARRPRFS